MMSSLLRVATLLMATLFSLAGAAEAQGYLPGGHPAAAMYEMRPDYVIEQMEDFGIIVAVEDLEFESGYAYGIDCFLLEWEIAYRLELLQEAAAAVADAQVAYDAARAAFLANPSEANTREFGRASTFLASMRAWHISRTLDYIALNGILSAAC